MLVRADTGSDRPRTSARSVSASSRQYGIDGGRQHADQTASAPVSPVRIRITCSTSRTKILPSPILPVRAALMMASTTESTTLSSTTTSIFYLGQKVDHIFSAAIQFGMALLTTETLHLSDGQTGDANFGQRFTYFVQFERFDNGCDLFHHFLLKIWQKIASSSESGERRSARRSFAEF